MRKCYIFEGFTAFISQKVWLRSFIVFHFLLPKELVDYTYTKDNVGLKIDRCMDR